MISRRTALVAGTAGVVAVAGGGVFLATRDKPEPPAPPSMDANKHMLWRNWSGTEHAYPAVRSAPRGEMEVVTELVASPAPIRVVGAGHSFSGLVPTSGTLMTLDAMQGFTTWEGDEAWASAGTRLRQLGIDLAKQGRAMASLPDIDKQSLGGCLATGTHGTGAQIKAIHGDVTGLRMVTVSGEIIDCDAKQNADVFQAAKVSLGALGVITQVRLKTIKNRDLHRRVWVEPLAEALAKAEERWARHRNFEFYAVPFTDLAANISHDETDAPAKLRGPDTDTAFLNVLMQLRNLTRFSTPLRKAAAKALLGGVEPEEAVDQGRLLLSTERPVRFNEMEFHLPVATHLAALKAVLAAIEAERPDVFFPIEVRRIAGDDAWLSPFQGGPRGSIAVHCHYKDEYDFLFSLIQPILRKHGGRPHWGKLHSLKAADLAALYPNWNDFLEVRRRLDPEGRLLNPYLKDLFGV